MPLSREDTHLSVALELPGCPEIPVNRQTAPLKNMPSARCLWLTPVILATQEAEIGRIEVQSQPREIVCKTLSRKNLSHAHTKKMGW
jgi:hypothetical protein